uniref:Uncharacterized protein n=1 Tax=Myotis myotis TaxID=51298 RepID=A0A7J8AN13_MYOMY|nr:hypothetical protein mMyoMyo1_008124 [Myotis myotis]
MLVLVSSVSHSAVKYTGFREDLTTYSKPYLLTCFSRGKDEFASHHPQPHLDLLAANDTFARLSASPGWKHSTQVEVLVSLILGRNDQNVSGQISQRSTAEICHRTGAASLVFLGFSFPFFLSLHSPTQEASPVFSPRE